MNTTKKPNPNPQASNPRAKSARTSGISMIELMISISVLIVVVLSAGFMLTAGIEQRRTAASNQIALTAIRDLVAEMQGVANLPLNLSADEGIGSIYQRYNGETRVIPGFDGATITITAWANETTVPAELGGPQDLNFDSDAADDLSGTANGSDLKVVPVRLSLRAGSPSVELLRVHRLITQTAE